MKFRKFLSIIQVTSAMTLPGVAHAVDQDALLSPDSAFKLESAVDKTHDVVALHFTIAPGYYLYRQRITAETDDGKPLLIESPPGIEKVDPNFGTVEIYHGSVDAKVADAVGSRVRLTWQGCAEAGVCFPQQTRELDATTYRRESVADGAPEARYEIADSAPSPSLSGAESLLSALHSTMNASDSSVNDALRHLGPAVTLTVFFLLGVALAFTPCMLPMLPIATAVVVGAKASRGRGFVLSLIYVLAMATMYAVVGVVAAIAGRNVQILLQQWWVNALFGATLVGLALAMFDVYTLQLPAIVREKLSSKSGSTRPGTAVGAAISGVLSALLVGPCMTAPLAGTLLYIAQTGSRVWGALVLLTLGVGLGVPFLIIGTVGTRFMPRPGAWSNRVNRIIGFALLATAIEMMDRVLPPQLTLSAWGAWLIVIAASLLRFLPLGGRLGVLCRSGVAVCGLWGGAALIGALAGATNLVQPLSIFAASAATNTVAHSADPLDFKTVDSLKGLEDALSESQRVGRIAMVDYSADWCTTCKTIERTVFADPRAERAIRDVTVIRADVTKSNAMSRELLSTFNVIGPPTILFFSHDGTESRNDRLVGEISTDQFLASLADAVRTQSGSASRVKTGDVGDLLNKGGRK
ncbi:protein-disulfide reductase DsbD [Paraburkholderia sp. JHI869]|uniref:protein-disulfide reductase DsbD n=1 Tax=Paraburkholderia sp. JHI869 TaxID=3112959 RepID=UPI003177FAAB